MKDFRARGYNRKTKQEFEVVGIVGLNTGEPRVQSPDTTMMLKDVDLLLYNGEVDSKNNRLFELDLVEYPVQDSPESEQVIRQGRVVFKNGQFKIEYDKPTGVNRFTVTTVENPKWKSCTKIGSLYSVKQQK